MGKKDSSQERIKVKRTSLTEQVFMNMKQCITDGVWKENEKIPSESELASMYGVNKLTIRLALQQLSALGIIETRVGEGSFVKKFNIFNYIDKASDFWHSTELIKDVRDFRQGVETECMRLACRNATDEDIALLKERLDEFEKARERLYKKKLTCTEHDEEFKELIYEMGVADYNFHAQISAMSHNSLLELSYRLARESIISYFIIQNQARIERVTARADDFIEFVKQNNHQNIYAAIKNHDLQKCIRSSYKMFDYTSI